MTCTGCGAAKGEMGDGCACYICPVCLAPEQMPCDHTSPGICKACDASGGFCWVCDGSGYDLYDGRQPLRGEERTYDVLMARARCALAKPVHCFEPLIGLVGLPGPFRDGAVQLERIMLAVAP